MTESRENRPFHPACRFGWQDGELLIGGRKVSHLHRSVGCRPFYAYDGGILQAQLAALREAIPQDVAVHYAVKANGFPPLLAFMSRLADGFDVASRGEMEALLALGVPAERLAFAGPGKGVEEIAAAVSAGVRIVIEDKDELDDVAAALAMTGASLPPPLAVRINPPFTLKRVGLRMGGEATAFGLPPEALGSLLARARALGLVIDGLHVFIGSQSLDGMALADSHRQTARLLRDLAVAHEMALAWVSLGGGYGIPYVTGERPLDLAPVAAGLRDAVAILRTIAPRAWIAIELGRYLVGGAGVYVMRVLRRKTVHGRTVLVTDGGLHHHLAATGNFGQVLHRPFPMALATRMPAGMDSWPAGEGEPRETVTIAGRLCTPLDVFARTISLPPARSGDLVAVFQSGAYGFEASPQAFLHHPPPARLFIEPPHAGES